MKFRTGHPPIYGAFQFDQQQPVLSIGSCFAENLAAKLTRYKFKVLSNPFGVNYNPVSIHGTLATLAGKASIGPESLIKRGDRWFSWCHDSRFSATDNTSLLEGLKDDIHTGTAFLQTTRIWIITYGTAWVYVEKQSGRVVANCHKAPAVLFERRRLTVDDVAEHTRKILRLARVISPEIKIIFTVSPVRHLKDGFHENQLSKSILLLGLEKALTVATENDAYFPAYELLLDDLRDYRFYQSDMLHPSPQAVDYIWGQLSKSFLNTQAQQIIREIEPLLKSIAHRPIAEESADHRQFLLKTIESIKRLADHYSFLDFHEEIQYLQSRIAGHSVLSPYASSGILSTFIHKP